jgi:flavodoxin
MRALVVYDSQYGNTERIATAIADTLRTVGDVRLVRVNAAQPLDLDGVDMLILGSPTQGWQPTKATLALLAELAPEQLHEMTIACFDTRFQLPRLLTGSAAKAMSNRIEGMGVRLTMPPESFFVEHTEGPLRQGELGRAAVWARLLLDKIAAPEPVMER